MRCKHCGETIELINGEWLWIKYQDGVGLIDQTTHWCTIPLKGFNGQVLTSYGALIPHEPAKNSKILDIINNL